jgi:membrane protein
VLTFAVSLLVITALFALIFKYLPDANVAWRDVAVGAVATAALFVGGKFALSIYLGHSDPGSAFGAAGSLALLLVWIYYSAIIVFLGAEFTQAWARTRGREIEPEAGTVRIIEGCASSAPSRVASVDDCAMECEDYAPAYCFAIPVL